MSEKFATLSALAAGGGGGNPPSRGAVVNPGNPANGWSEVDPAGVVMVKVEKPHAQSKLLSPTDKCKVCNEPAAKHVHYGAMTCFSCRAFFRRSIQNKTASTYTCRRNKSCEINLKTRKSCQYCRYQSCLDVGMKPTWVLSPEERQRRFRKQREKQAMSQGGRSRNSESFGDDEFGEYNFDDYQDEGGDIGPSPASSIAAAEESGGEEDQRIDDHQQQQLVVDEQQQLAHARGGSVARRKTKAEEKMNHTAGGVHQPRYSAPGKSLATPHIQLSQVRPILSSSSSSTSSHSSSSCPSTPTTTSFVKPPTSPAVFSVDGRRHRSGGSDHMENGGNSGGFLAPQRIKNEPRSSPVSPPVFEMSQVQVVGVKEEPRAFKSGSCSSDMDQQQQQQQQLGASSFNTLNSCNKGELFSQKVYLSSSSSSRMVQQPSGSVIVSHHHHQQQQLLMPDDLGDRCKDDELQLGNLSANFPELTRELSQVMSAGSPDGSGCVPTADLHKLVDLITSPGGMGLGLVADDMIDDDDNDPTTVAVGDANSPSSHRTATASPAGSSGHNNGGVSPAVSSAAAMTMGSASYHQSSINSQYPPVTLVASSNGTGEGAEGEELSGLRMIDQQYRERAEFSPSPQEFFQQDVFRSNSHTFSTTQFVEAHLEGAWKVEKNEGEDDEEGEEEIYTDSDEETLAAYRAAREMTPDEAARLDQLVVSHDERYKSVNFGEELIKEMIMCSMFGIPVSTTAAINGYRLIVERVSRIANDVKEFVTLCKADQAALLKENADLLVSLRGAIFFDSRKGGVEQLLISMGVDDMSTIKTMFRSCLKEDQMKHINYKTFNSIQAVGQNDSEDRYNFLQEKIGKTLSDPKIQILLTYILLFSPDFCVLQEQRRIEDTQCEFLRILERYIGAMYPRVQATIVLANSLEVITNLREMADIKKARTINPTVRLP